MAAVRAASQQREFSKEVEDAASDPASTELCSEEDSASDCSSDLDDDDEPPPFFTADTILLFDWDDTVLPSTWISEQGLRLDTSVISEEQQVTLQRLADSAGRTLEAAKRYGKVLLVTNAEDGWIEMSCQKFLPSLWQRIEGVKRLSARSTYEQKGVLSPFEWKYLAFESEIGAFCRERSPEACDERRKNIISFGDSAHEREALIRVTENLQKCCTKSMKFVERPDVEQLLREHELISGCFRYIVNHDGNLDLCIRCP